MRLLLATLIRAADLVVAVAGQAMRIIAPQVAVLIKVVLAVAVAGVLIQVIP